MSRPYQVQLEPQRAQELFEQGAAVLVLDMPAGTVFGLDQHSFLVGPKFQGVKMIPPGTHFVSFRAVSSQSASASPLTGTFLYLKPKQVVVRRWDVQTETLVSLQEEEEERYAAGVRRYDFDQCMAPYNLQGHAAWTSVSNQITASLVARLSPKTGSICIIFESQDTGSNAAMTSAEKRLQAQLHPESRMEDSMDLSALQINEPTKHSQALNQSPEVEMQAGLLDTSEQPSTHTSMANTANAQDQAFGNQIVSGSTPSHALSDNRCRYTQLPRLVKQAGATPAELTAMNMDKSIMLKQLLSEQYGGQFSGLLGELQFAFIAFVYGQSLDGYAQWKAILILLLGCEAAILGQLQPSFTQAIDIVHCQLSLSFGNPEDSQQQTSTRAQQTVASAVTPFGDSMIEELLPDSFLKRMFGRFFTMLQENGSEVGSQLFSAASQLKSLLRQHLGWEYDFKVLPGADSQQLSSQGYDMHDADEDEPLIVEDPSDFITL